MKRKILLVIALAFISHNSIAQKSVSTEQTKMNSFISSLMAKMTIEEKLGQLNLPSSGDIATGQANSSDIGKKIRKGQVGGLFNIKGVKR